LGTVQRIWESKRTASVESIVKNGMIKEKKEEGTRVKSRSHGNQGKKIEEKPERGTKRRIGAHVRLKKRGMRVLYPSRNETG